MHWVALDSAKSILDSGSGHPGRWAGTRLIELLLPASRVLRASLHLQTHNRRQLVKLLPYVLEDQCLSSPELCHVAASAAKTGFPSVSLVARDWLQLLLQRLASDGLTATAAYSLADCLVANATEWHGYIDGEAGYVRTSGGGFSFDPGGDGAPAELLLALRDEQGRPQRIVLHVPSGADCDFVHQWQLPAGVDLQCKDDWDWRTARLQADPVNLLQGEFGASGGLHVDWRRIRPTLVLAAMVAGLYLASGITEWWRLSQRYQALTASIEQAARKVIPAGPLIDPVAQLQRHLQDSRQSGGGMLAYAQRVSPALAPVQLNGMRFAQGELTLLPAGADAAQLDALQKRLEAAGFKVERKQGNGAVELLLRDAR